MKRGKVKARMQEYKESMDSPEKPQQASPESLETSGSARPAVAEQDIQHITAIIHNSVSKRGQPMQERPADELIIWTPSFMILFSLVFIVGLSMASMLTQGWLNGYYAAETILLAGSMLLLGCWIVLLIIARSASVRLGAIFGGLWAIFNGVSLVITLFKGDYSYMHFLASCSLLGCYFYLSSNRAGSKDRWLVRSMLLAGGLIIVTLYWSSLVHAMSSPGTAIAAVVLSLCAGIWWLRPARWRDQPSPTFFFGLAPAILLLFSLPHKGETNFFFSQIILLCVLLGVIRVIQAELRARTVQLDREEHLA